MQEHVHPADGPGVEVLFLAKQRQVPTQAMINGSRNKGIVVHVRNRRVDPLHAGLARFERRDFTHGVGVLRIASRSDGHLRRKRSAFIQSHGGAAFEVRSDQQRQLGNSLQLIA